MCVCVYIYIFESCSKPCKHHPEKKYYLNIFGRGGEFNIRPQKKKIDLYFFLIPVKVRVIQWWELCDKFNVCVCVILFPYM